MRPGAVAALAEAEILGITGGGALTTFGRHLIAADGAAAELALAEAMPPAVDEFLLQPDLDGGRAWTAQPGVGGGARDGRRPGVQRGAQVWRLTRTRSGGRWTRGHRPTSWPRCCAPGPRTPVPQALAYLIEAHRPPIRRRLRAGGTRAYSVARTRPCCDQVCADPRLEPAQLHRVAGTVAVSGADLDVPSSLLRRAGYAPAAEDGSGAALTVRAEPPRARPPRRSDRTLTSAGLSPEALAETVRRIRLGDEAGPDSQPGERLQVPFPA